VTTTFSIYKFVNHRVISIALGKSSRVYEKIYKYNLQKIGKEKRLWLWYRRGYIKYSTGI